MDVSTQNVACNKTALKKRKKRAKEKRKKEGGRATESGADGRRGGRKSTVGEKETTSGVFCNRRNDLGRNGERRSIVGKEALGKKQEEGRSDDDRTAVGMTIGMSRTYSRTRRKHE